MMPLNPPIWRFRCPLCLKRLVLPEQLIIFKAASANMTDERDSSELIYCAPDFMQEVRDFVGHLGDDIAGGVFASHVNCEAKHPWLATRMMPSKDGEPPSPVTEISIPGKDEDGETCPVQFTCSMTATPIKKKIQHWTVRMLRDTAKHSKTHEAMWFPYLLLAATAAANEMDSSRPCGNLVELAGTREVGKTILTMQLMHEELFGRLADDRRINSFQYFFSRGASGESFPKEVYTFSAWKDQPTFRPLSTEPTPGDLRAIFIERVSPSGSAADRRSEFGSPEKKEGRFQRALRSLRDLVNQARVNMADEEPVLPEIAEPFVPTPSPQWVPILFYDSAGESQESRSDTIRRLHSLTNKLAICIDAEELIDPRKEKTSIKHACSRLDDLTHQRYRRRSTCIVVTKTDLIEGQLTRQERLSLYLKGEPNSSRELLSRLLKKGATDDLGSLLAYLSRDEPERIIDDVFFVSTRRLPFMHGIRLSPIESFSPASAAPGDQLIVKAASGYKFKVASGEVTEDEKGTDVVLRVKKVLIHRQPADFEIEDSETIKVIVPESARGFIEIVSERWDEDERVLVEDKANSERFFNVLDVATRESLKPISLGLIPFLAWCGDISESDIVRESRIIAGQDPEARKEEHGPSVGVT